MSIGSSVVTTGRGGAGNIGSSQLKPTDRHHAMLQTPTLKGAMYTTGVSLDLPFTNYQKSRD